MIAQPDIETRMTEVRELALEIDRRLIEEVQKLGFDDSQVSLKGVDEAMFRLEQDPASGQFSLVGDWLDPRGLKLGLLLFHADGSFFVEQDVVKPHPSNKRWFVEAVNAWGRDQDIRAEARLIAALE